MTDRPSLFSGPMVRALLEGRKTQTRRVLKKQPFDENDFLQNGKFPYIPRDRIYVRESIRRSLDNDNFYYADKGVGNALYRRLIENGGRKSRPSIHMPRWASRLTLPVTDVRVQRLQDISEEDAKAEGAMFHDGGCVGHSGYRHDIDQGVVYATARESFKHLWDSINANRKDKDGNRLPYAWDDNPWVVAVSFDVHKVNIDLMGGAS